MMELEVFMSVYMFTLEIFLQTRKEELCSISYYADEANTDRPLKELLKELIEDYIPKIPDFCNINTVTIDGTDYAVSPVKSIVIQRVLLPEDITPRIKARLMEGRTSLYTAPDLCLELLWKGDIYYQPIELKTTKQNAIPGSSVQQVDPYGWVVFIQHQGVNIKISTGQYLHAINAHMQFPDRSPRPSVSFSTLSRWNQTQRNFQGDNLIYAQDPQDEDKLSLLNDWRAVLVQRWIDTVFSSPSRQTEPWFDQTMRKFILAFLQRYEALSPQEREQLRAHNKMILENNQAASE